MSLLVSRSLMLWTTNRKVDEMSFGGGVETVIGIIPGVMDVGITDDDPEDGVGLVETAVAFETPTQAFQFSIFMVQSVVIDTPAISHNSGLLTINYTPNCDGYLP